MSPFALPVRRPVATTMIFVAIALLGVVAWQRMPVELFPALTGNELTVSFFRPGSEPEVVEREILLPLEARVAELPGVDETSAEISGSGGTFSVRFDPGVDIETRELDLTRVAGELRRTQPRGTVIEVAPDPLTRFSQARFAMYVHVIGIDDRNALLDFVDERIVPRVAAVPGVSQVSAFGGAPRELTVHVDPERCSAAGVLPEQVVGAINGAVRRLEYLGGVEDEAGRTAVVLDARPRGVISLGSLRVAADRPVLLRHVADIELSTGRETTQFRVNGKPAVGLLISQDETANLVRLNRELRTRLAELRGEYSDYGLDFVTSYDGGEIIEDQLNRLERLALSGFGIALLALFLFLREVRAVAVVGIAVPTSLLCALALLFLAGQSLNVITLFGLAIGIGMLVDNSIVVYEAVQRRLERGHDRDDAAEGGVRHTVRAILAATATNAIVFLPVTFIDLESTALRSTLEIVVLAILLPLAGSVLVALGLVPLLAHRLAAPAALAALETRRLERERNGGFTPPDRPRELFGGVLTVALRRPAGWIAGVTAVILLTLILAVPLVTLGSANTEAPESTQIQMPVTLEQQGSLEAAVAVFRNLEAAAADLSGVERVESFVQESGGQITVHLPERDERPADLDASRVRATLRGAAAKLDGVDLTAAPAAGSGGGIQEVFGGGGVRIVVSGPDAVVLGGLARDIEGVLESIAEVGEASVSARSGRDEIRVVPRNVSLDGFGLTADQVLPALNIVGREGVELTTGFTLPDGREIPMTVRRLESAGEERAVSDLRELRLATPAGVLPLAALATIDPVPPPATITHRDGRREIEVSYSFGADAPTSGPARQDLEERIAQAISQVNRPAGYAVETPDDGGSLRWFKRILLPVLGLLFVVLAITFESLTLPLLVLLSLPLTILGSTWALLLTGTPLDNMGMIGVVALIGVTVNPAILLVDRMQQRAWGGGRSAGAAALAAVRERTRPVLMTAATTVAALWPLAIVTGADNEIWPPFAVVVMGGLVTSTLLTLMVIPVGFVFLHRLDRTFGRLGPWVIIGWVAVTSAIMTPLIVGDVIVTLTWQVITAVLVGGGLLALAAWSFHRPERPMPASEDGGPPRFTVRSLHKIYGRPGPVGRAWRATERFAKAVRPHGGQVFSPARARRALLPLLLLCGASIYLAVSLQSGWWRMVYAFVAAGLAGAIARGVRKARGRADELGRVEPGGIEGAIALTTPWVALVWVASALYAVPLALGEPVSVARWVLVGIAVLLPPLQLARRTAVRMSRGELADRVDEGRLRRVRTTWRRFCRATVGLDLPREQVHALRGVEFEVREGMVGILGPNGAGKTTLLRQMAGIFEPSIGTVSLGGVRLEKLRSRLADWIGYLPQDFGLPEDLTAREYLDYYALLYRIGSEAERRERVEHLLAEVGLGDRADERIGNFSGGMRQRVAVARTLLRLPPVIIVDEPTVGLDPRERIRFRNLLSRLADGRVVLFSTHVVEDVEVACQRVIVFARGRIVFDGEPLDLAGEAEGRVWSLRRRYDDAEPLAAGSMIVDEVPETDEEVRLRILSPTSPHPAAGPAAPTLEDGYLWLVGERPAGEEAA